MSDQSSGDNSSPPNEAAESGPAQTQRAPDGGAPGTPAQDNSAQHKAALGKPVIDHLGQVLRSEYNRVAEKPAYFGDDTPLPPEFEHKLLAIEKSEEIREKGVEAVGEALGLFESSAEADLSEGDNDGGASKP